MPTRRFSLKRLSLFVSLSLLLPLLTRALEAGEIAGRGGGVLARLVGGTAAGIAVLVGYLFLWLAGGILHLLFTWLEWLIQGGLGWGYTRNNPMIEVGFPLIRNISNTLFLLSLLYIGIMQALGKAGIKAQRMVPRLVVGAIMANFTPVIVGVIVDVSNILMNFFLVDLSGYKYMISVITSNIYTLDNILNQSGQINIIVTTIISAIVIFVLILTIALFFVIFLLRYVAIWLITILGPLAAVSWVFAGTSAQHRGFSLGSLWEKWWSALLQWSFIGVTTAFFLFLSNTALVQSKNIETSLGGVAVGFIGNATLSVILVGWMPFIVAGVLTFMGLNIALSMSAMGAGFILSRVQGMARGVLGWGKRQGLGALKFTAATAAYIPTLGAARGAKGITKRVLGEERYKRLSTGLRRTGRRMTGAIGRVPIVGGVATGAISKAGEKGSKILSAIDIEQKIKAQNRLKNYKSDLKKASDEDLVKILTAAGEDPAKKAAALLLLNEKGKAPKELPPGTENQIRNLMRANLIKEEDVAKMFANNPELLKEKGEAERIFSVLGIQAPKIAKHVKPKQATKLPDHFFENANETLNILTSLPPNSLKALMTKGDIKSVARIINSLGTLLANPQERLQSLKKFSPAQIEALVSKGDDLLFRLQKAYEKESDNNLKQLYRDAQNNLHLLLYEIVSPEFLFAPDTTISPAQLYSVAVRENQPLVEKMLGTLKTAYNWSRARNALVYPRKDIRGNVHLERGQRVPEFALSSDVLNNVFMERDTTVQDPQGQRSFTISAHKFNNLLRAVGLHISSGGAPATQNQES